MVVTFEQLEPLDLGSVNGPDSRWTEAVPLGPPDLRHGTLNNGLKCAKVYARSRTAQPAWEKPLAFSSTDAEHNNLLSFAAIVEQNSAEMARARLVATVSF